MRMRLTMLVILALLAMPLSLPASADTTGVGTLTGLMEVGKWFVTPCDKLGWGRPTGRGLYDLGTVTIPGVSNGDDTREEEGTWRFRTLGNATGTSQAGPFAGLIELSLCGWLSAVADSDRSERNTLLAIGAACQTMKAHHGQGNIYFPVVGERLKVFNFGWKASVAGTVPISGQYQEYANDDSDPRSAAKKDKVGQILGQGQVQGGAACLGLKQPFANSGNGAQLFNAIWVIEFVNGVSFDEKESIPDPGGPKQCKGVGQEAWRDPFTGKKNHWNKPAPSECDGGEK